MNVATAKKVSFSHLRFFFLCRCHYCCRFGFDSRYFNIHRIDVQILYNVWFDHHIFWLPLSFCFCFFFIRVVVILAWFVVHTTDSLYDFIVFRCLACQSAKICFSFSPSLSLCGLRDFAWNANNVSWSFDIEYW